MSLKKIFRCQDCGHETEVYEGRGFMGQHIEAMSCSDRIHRWDMHTCPKCGGKMQPTGEEEFWT